MTTERKSQPPELPKELEQAALASLFLAMARVTAWTLGAIYLALAVAKPFLYSSPRSLLATLSAVDGFVALSLFSLALTYQRATPASRWPQPVTVGAIALMLSDSVITMHLQFKPLETTVFVLAAFCASLVFTSRLWFHMGQVVTVLMWAIAVRFSAPGPLFSPAAPWTELGITLAAAVLVAELMFLVRRRVYIRMEALRYAEARQREELETAMDTLKVQHEQLQTLDRFRTDFVNAVTHDLRNPLTSIRGYAELLMEEPPDALPQRERGYLGQIEKSTRRLERLVDDMLDFARLDSGNFALGTYSADLGRLLRDIAESFGPQAQTGALALTVVAPEAPLWAEMDVERIERVVGNLLANAIKFTPAGGTIEIRAFQADGHFMCEIEDTGAGIAQEDLPLLFQRFSQLKEGRKIRSGTGLGLSISKAIVEAHGGRIGVRSVLGEGSVFWFTLPRYPETATA
jgi:signal transduction histidine kinase